MQNISEEDFRNLLQKKLDTDWERALKLFKEYGPYLAYNVTKVLAHATDKEKRGEVLSILEEHFNVHLKYHDPEVRGRVGNSTQLMFLGICVRTLGIEEPVPV